MSLDDLGYELSWTDLAAYIRYPRQDSALLFVSSNPPVDPATVPTKNELAGVSNRLAEKRRQLAGKKSTTTSLSDKQVKKQARELN